jgi:F0F1-type ATP synthase membrane subunit b/b'
LQKQFNEYQDNTDEKLEQTQKQLSEIRGDFKKYQNKTKETIKRSILNIEDNSRHERGV